MLRGDADEARILLVLPLLVPLFTAIACLFSWHRLRTQQLLGTAGSAGLLLAVVLLFRDVYTNGMAATQVGGWPAPFGITVVADHLAAILLLSTGTLALTGSIYSVAFLSRRQQAGGYFPLFHLMLMGVCGAFLAGDVFNFYVWIELILLSSFVLMSLGARRRQLEATLKYMAANLLGSFLFLAAVGLLYAATGTLNLADLAQKARATDPGVSLTLVAMIFLCALGIKAAVFPLFLWLPASYPAAPLPALAVFSGLLTKVGVYGLIRLFTLLFVQDVGLTHGLILVLSGFTMLTGVLGAVAQNDLRRLLSFHIISQIGYMTMGLALFSRLAVAAAIFFIVHIMVTKTALFLVAGVAHRMTGSYNLHRMGGFYRRSPALVLCFLVPALSLGGVPPLSGFAGKMALVQAGLELRQYGIVAVALVVSLLTLYSMTKIWTHAFWATLPREVQYTPLDRPTAVGLLVPIGILALIAIGMGLAAGPIFEVTLTASDELLNPDVYIETVMGGSGS